MNSPPADLNLVFDAAALRERVLSVLSKFGGMETLFQNEDCRYGVPTSSVLLLLGWLFPQQGGIPEIGIILNKRSKEVRQPGDLCCPGGAIEKLDHFLARLLAFRGSSLSRWPCWSALKTEQPQNADFLSLLYAAGLREAWEEMGLNPFGLTFLGPLPTQCLVLYRRSVHPMVAWVSYQKRFHLSSEVERIVRFPLRALLNPFNYAVYRRFVPPHLEWRFREAAVDFPCFVYKIGERAELLWGVTFKIVTQFMEMIFGFRVPDIEKLPMVPASLDEEYVTGRTRNGARQNHLSYMPLDH
ncbi:MAG TPA: CoA pyrophosphatase [Syntrophobacteraceae bacterium]|nr:CoA pyrophosphatase [Syntrophobacteraceae bacterium]